LDDAPQRGDGTDLFPDESLDLMRDIFGGDGGGGVRRGRERDEGKGELALEGVGDADDAGFGDEGMGGDGLLDATYELVSTIIMAVR
jgi:hypothetical protein